MRKVILYVAVSLDGYIADAQKSVHWIKGQDDSAEMLDTQTKGTVLLVCICQRHTKGTVPLVCGLRQRLESATPQR